MSLLLAACIFIFIGLVRFVSIYEELLFQQGNFDSLYLSLRKLHCISYVTVQFFGTQVGYSHLHRP